MQAKLFIYVVSSINRDLMKETWVKMDPILD